MIYCCCCQDPPGFEFCSFLSCFVHSLSCWESIRDISTHPITPRQCLKQRLILEDERGSSELKIPHNEWI
jgi:hypothetical protein